MEATNEKSIDYRSDRSRWLTHLAEFLLKKGWKNAIGDYVCYINSGDKFINDNYFALMDYDFFVRMISKKPDLFSISFENPTILMDGNGISSQRNYIGLIENIKPLRKAEKLNLKYFLLFYGHF